MRKSDYDAGEIDEQSRIRGYRGAVKNKGKLYFLVVGRSEIISFHLNRSKVSFLFVLDLNTGNNSWYA